MVRIAGVDRDVSLVELTLSQMEPDQALMETAGWLANTRNRIGQDFEAIVELDSGEKVKVSVEKVKVKK